MQWSKYQTAIFEDNIKGAGNKFVVATAGSGKTTVIEKCINDVPFSDSVLAIAFGVDIKKELERRLGHLANVTVKTLNGFGYGAVRGQVKRYIKIDKKKVENLLFFDVMKKCATKEEKDVYYGSRYLICKIIGLLKADMIWKPDDTDIMDMIEYHGMTLPKKIPFSTIAGLVKQTYELNWKKTVVLDFDDQVSMPLYFNWPVETFKRVFADEAQDFTKAQIELTSLAQEPGSRFYFVGDPRQAIYLFRGADSHAVENIISRMQCDKLPLSVCYRCSKAVVRRAQQKAPEIEYAENAAEGSDEEVTTADFRNQVGDGDFVLCRTTAPIVSECLRALRAGRKASVRGREIGEGLIDFIDAVGYAADDSEGFLSALVEYVTKRQEALLRTGREDALIALNDSSETLRVFAEEAKTVSGIKAKIEAIFDNDQKAGIMFMTGHKSKGLEAPRVWILRPDQLPHKMATTEEQLVAEDNLWFVMVTRCKMDLRWVKHEGKQASIDL